MKGLKDFFGRVFGKRQRAKLRGAKQEPVGDPERPRQAPSVPEAAYEKADFIGGNYLVHSLLGKGAFGEVYLVYHRETYGVFALKTFRQKFLADAKVKEDFKRETLLWVNLEEHPFIVAARKSAVRPALTITSHYDSLVSSRWRLGEPAQRFLLGRGRERENTKTKERTEEAVENKRLKNLTVLQAESGSVRFLEGNSR